MPDPIPPPAAREPAEALELAAQALSDGDLEAALAQYEPGARLLTFQSGPQDTVLAALTGFMALRLPLAVRIDTVRVGTGPHTAGVALVSCARQTAGTGPDGEEVAYHGDGCAVVRAQPDGTWRIAADVWRLDGNAPGPELPPEPPEIPPEPAGDAGRGEGQAGSLGH
jgi:ketosteroid isomerase-like protein